MRIQGLRVIQARISDHPVIVPGAVLNLDPDTGVSGSTWSNTGSLGSTLDYTLFNNPTTYSYNGSNVLSFPGGVVQPPGAMTNPYAFNSTGFVAMASAGQAFTLDIWAYPKAAGCLIKEYGNASPGYPVAGWEDAWINFVGGNINVSVWPYNGSNFAVGSYTLNQWYNIQLVYNGSNQSLVYVNGVLGSPYGTQNFTRQTEGTYCQLCVAGPERYGYLGGPTGYWNGYVGPFKMYYSALNSSQVQQNYNAIKYRYGL